MKPGETHERVFGHLSQTPERVQPMRRIKYSQQQDHVGDILTKGNYFIPGIEAKTKKINQNDPKELRDYARKTLMERQYNFDK